MMYLRVEDSQGIFLKYMKRSEPDHLKKAFIMVLSNYRMHRTPASMNHGCFSVIIKWNVVLFFLVLLMQRCSHVFVTGFSTTASRPSTARTKYEDRAPTRFLLGQNPSNVAASRLQMTLIPTFAGSKLSLSAASAVVHVLLGSSGTPVVARAIAAWYTKIDKPAWTPPNRLFAPVWTILYSLMGISFARILQKLTALSSTATAWRHPLVWIWMGHMALNLIWAPVFFGYQQLRAGFYINCGLLFSLGAVIPWYWHFDPFAAYLLLPYTLWLLYATCLNRAIDRRNPGPYNAARFYAQLDQLQRKAKHYADSFPTSS
jgi:translocator protein